MATQAAHTLYPFSGKAQNTALSDFYAENYPTDEQLWKDFQEGSGKAYAIIYQRYAAGLYGYGLKQVHDKELVMDCIQEFYLKLWQVKEQLGQVYAIGPYVFKSFRRYIHNQAKRKHKIIPLSSFTVPPGEATPSREHNLVEKERFNSQHKELKEALDQLNETQREIIYLKFYGHLGYEEIADILKLDKKAVYNAMARAMKQLRDRLHFALWVSLFTTLMNSVN